MDQNQEDRILRLFGEKLKEARMRKGLSTRELADLAEMNLGNISDLELGKKNPLLTSVYKLAEALGMHPRELLS